MLRQIWSHFASCVQVVPIPSHTTAPTPVPGGSGSWKGRCNRKLRLKAVLFSPYRSQNCLWKITGSRRKLLRTLVIPTNCPVPMSASLLKLGWDPAKWKLGGFSLECCEVVVEKIGVKRLEATFLGIFGWAASTQSSHAAFGAWFWKRFLCVTSARRYDAAHWHLQAEHLLAPSPESFCLPKVGWKNCCLASCGCVRQTKCFGSLRSTSFKRGFASHLRTSEGNNCGAHFGCALAVARGQPDPVEIRLVATAKLSSVLHSFQTWGWLLAGNGATCRRSLLRWGMVNSDKGDLWMTIKRHIDVGLTLEENSPLPVDSRGN